MGSWLFDGWATLARTLVVGVLGYVALIVLLRFSGKRTLAKMNGFDLVVTVALGSSLASLLTSRDVPLAQGVLSFVTLIGMQCGITWLALRSATVRRSVKNDPTLLVYRGEMLEEALHRERITKAEVLSAVRSQGIAALQDVEAVVFETNGSLSVVVRSGERASTLPHAPQRELDGGT